MNVRPKEGVEIYISAIKLLENNAEKYKFLFILL